MAQTLKVKLDGAPWRQNHDFEPTCRSGVCVFALRAEEARYHCSRPLEGARWTRGARGKGDSNDRLD